MEKLNGWKKIIACFLIIAFAVLNESGVTSVPEEVTYALIAYIVGQGMADVGKHRSQE